MPLRNGYSEATISRNIAELIDAGRAPAQAEAIAYDKARESWRKRHPSGPWPAHLRPPQRKTRTRAVKKRTAKKKKTAARKRNPATRGTGKSRRAYERFHGEPPKRQRRVYVPEPPEVGWELGRVLGIAYETVRDGQRLQYMHEFAAKSAPRLVISEDGRGMFLAGGKYRVTSRGIEDR